VSTRVGYAGGTTRAPAYHAIGDHSESLEVVFDPKLISYEALLTEFLAAHNPCGRANVSRQYRAAVFYANEEQRQLAELALERRVVECEGPVSTAIEPATPFALAEDYHQKYLLRRSPTVLAELTGYYPKLEDFVASTAVTRANAFLGGNGSEQRVREDSPRMGLTDEAVAQLVSRAR
jgi:peptide-methionine (S)-S-oxide reductase